MELTETMLRDSGIPKAYWRLDTTTYKGNTRTLRQLEAYISRLDDMFDAAVGVRILGPLNSYKTFLGTYLLKNALAKYKSVAYVTLDKLTKICIEEDMESYLLEHDYVAIDEVDLPKRQDSFPCEVFLRAVRLRRNNDLPTVFMSRLELHELKDLYGEDATGLTDEFVTLRTKSNAFAADPARADLRKGIEDVK